MASELANSVVMETTMVSRVWEWYKSGQEKTLMGSEIYSLWYSNQKFANGEGEPLLWAWVGFGWVKDHVKVFVRKCSWAS